MDTYLDFAWENYDTYLEESLDQLTSGSSGPEIYFTIVHSYRVLAICALLLDADPQTFTAHCARSAYARLAFLRELDRVDQVDPRYLCTSKNIAFSAALAAGALETASELAARSPEQHFELVEYEDDFLFFHFLHRAILEPEDDLHLKQIVERWEAVLEGGSSGYLDVCRVLSRRDANELDPAMVALIDTREAQLQRYLTAANFNPELYATEGKVFLEGVAVLRLAEMRGIHTQDEYKFIPDLARIPLGAEHPAFETWRSYS